MSQAKVDKYKKDKKNRAKIMKRQRIKKYTAVVIIAMMVGGLLGIPIGKIIYKESVKKANANKTISSLEFDSWFHDYWAENYYDIYAGAELATEDSSDEDLDAYIEDTEDNSESDTDSNTDSDSSAE